MNNNSKIFVAWYKWLVWSAIVRQLESQWYDNLLLRTRQEVDLMDERATAEFFAVEKPEYVFLAAAKVWGILANRDYPADFIYQNLKIQNNVIHSSYVSDVKKLLFLGSSCIYPKLAKQPLTEDSLLTGTLEPTNEPYAIAKIAGIKMCQSYNRQYGTNFIACMPTNLYGPYDNFDLKTSHVLPALIRKFHTAKVEWHSSVLLWGDGTPMREFLYVDDMANACIYLMNNYSPLAEENEKWYMFLNIGTWTDVTIRELAETIRDVVGYEWELHWDASKPNGTPRKLMNVDRLTKAGWTYSVELNEWVKRTYDWFLENIDSIIQ